MKKILLLIILFLSFQIYHAQGTQDTIRVAMLQEFSVPQTGALIVNPVLSINFNADLLDENLTVIRQCNDIEIKYSPNDFRQKINQINNAGTDRRGWYNYCIIKETLETPGNYIIRINVNAQNEFNSRFQKSFDYPVVVSVPTMAMKVDLKNLYYIGETYTFSFATVEYVNPQLYSYTISDNSGNVVSTGNGPLVVLDSILASQSNAGKKFIIEGYYKNQPFLYNSGVENQLPNTTKWEFEIAEPSLYVFTDWLDLDAQATNPNANERRVFSILNEAALEFRFTYSRRSERTGEFVFTRPDEMTIRSVSTIPDNILTDQRVVRAGAYVTLSFKFNDRFRNRILGGDIVPVNIQIEYNTPFGGRTLRYSAILKQ